MKNNFLIIFLVLLASVAFYFLGKKSAANEVKTEVVQNIAIIKEIAELAALDVKGTTNLKISNRGDNNSMWEKLKNFLAENTLQLSIPFDAKYGVDMSNQQVKIDTKEGTVLIYLPQVKLLSLQLELDKVDAISKTGLLNVLSVQEYIKAQKQLYQEASAILSTNAGYEKLAQEHIRSVFEQYYKPLGLKVTCIFGNTKSGLQ